MSTLIDKVPGAAKRPVAKTGGMTVLGALAVAAAAGGSVMAGPAAFAADSAGATFSKTTVTEGNKPLEADGFLTGSQDYGIQKWGGSAEVRYPAGSFVVLNADITIPDGAKPGQTFMIDLGRYWSPRTGTPAPLVDPDGKIIATAAHGAAGEGQVVFTLTDYVKDRVNLKATYSMQAQEFAPGEVRPAGDHVQAVTDGNGVALAQMKLRLGEPRWDDRVLYQGWSGEPDSPDGLLDARSGASWDGKSDVIIKVTAGAGYDIDCSSLANTDPAGITGIGLADIGASDNSVPTAANFLDPAKYTLACDKAGYTVTMPASSWTSADAASGQVLLARAGRIANMDKSWTAEGGVYGYVEFTQDGVTTQMTSFNNAPNSVGTGSSDPIEPGKYQVFTFEDVVRDNAYDAKADRILPNVPIRIQGTSDSGEAVDLKLTTDDKGFLTRALLPGKYSATATAPEGFIEVEPNVGDEKFDSDFSRGRVTFTILSGKTVRNDAGYFAPKAGLGHIKRVLEVTDTNNNGVTGDEGDTIAYAFAVENTGNTDLTTAILEDKKLGITAKECLTGPLAPGKSIDCDGTFTYTITAGDAAAGNVHNLATVTIPGLPGVPSEVTTPVAPAPAAPSQAPEQPAPLANTGEVAAQHGMNIGLIAASLAVLAGLTVGAVIYQRRRAAALNVAGNDGTDEQH